MDRRGDFFPPRYLFRRAKKKWEKLEIPRVGEFIPRGWNNFLGDFLRSAIRISVNISASARLSAGTVVPVTIATIRRGIGCLMSFQRIADGFTRRRWRKFMITELACARVGDVSKRERLPGWCGIETSVTQSLSAQSRPRSAASRYFPADTRRHSPYYDRSDLRKSDTSMWNVSRW